MSESVHIISLGCPKNRVDSEIMLSQIKQGDYSLTNDADDADVIVVNTCSFIQPATEESIETVLQMAKKKADAKCKKLIVTGCMVQRYGRALEDELPEVDFFLGTGEYHRIAEILQKKKEDLLSERSFIDTPLYIHDEFSDHLPSWKRHSAYLKISEGCNHRCSFCIIPTLRGKLRSRSISSLVAEAERLSKNGVVELNLVSQDSTAYGRDLGDGTDLGMLLRSLSTVEKIKWLRLHYAYPIGLPQSLLEAIADEDKICKYIDIPLQHASGSMLKRMRRGVTRSGQERILERIHSYIPDVTLRTTFIVGFPGETDKDFDILCDFVRQQKFDHVGVFSYFKEDGTAAANLSDQVPDHIKEQRRRHLMSIQAEISKNNLKRFLNKEVTVLIDGPSAEHPFVQAGRIATQAPDVDGVVYIDGSDDSVVAGEFYKVRINQTTEHDLVGELIWS